ncbi:hypothetical protein [Streptomyces sp. NPDC020996]|uniref:hypothetical protein n=1 Tax=Streptomyces sp. NPDC020996 TaxID=3154791 RepID=UPI0033CDFBB9
MVLVVSAAPALTGPGRWSLDQALGVTPWPLWAVLAAVVAGPVSGLLTRLVLHRPSAATKGKPYAQAAE